jgi:hypothetical protein
MTRHRLIPTRGTKSPSWFVYGAEEAQASAAAYFKEHGAPVLVCKFPEHGLTTALYIHPQPRKGRQCS